MRVILHADDFGFDKDTTLATIELLETGALTSATIMATMPEADKAIAYAARHPEFSFGVHLTYVDGLKPAVLGDATSLTDENGVFYPSNDVRKKAILLKLKTDDIVEESLAQIEKVRLGGGRNKPFGLSRASPQIPIILTCFAGNQKTEWYQ